MAWEIWTFSAVTSLCILKKTVSDWIYLKTVVLFYICHLWMDAISMFLEVVDMGLENICFYTLNHRNRKSQKGA